MRAAPLYAQLDFLVEQKKQIERDLLREANKHPIARILETEPGFGPIRSTRLVPRSMLEAGTKPNLAKLSVARTIAATVSSMGKHEEETQPEQIRRSMTTDRGV